MEGAPGPAATPPPDPSAPRSDRQTDPRAARLQQERELAAAGESMGSARPEFWEFQNPAASILIGEVQELSRKVDTIGTAALAGIWLLGMIVGAGVFYLAKAAPVAVESEGTEQAGESVDDG